VLKISLLNSIYAAFPKGFHPVEGFRVQTSAHLIGKKIFLLENSFVGWVLSNSSLVLHTLVMNTCHLLLFQNSLT
jgi:hypothetical protein